MDGRLSRSEGTKETSDGGFAQAFAWCALILHPAACALQNALDLVVYSKTTADRPRCATVKSRHKHTCRKASGNIARCQVRPRLPPCLPKSKFANNGGGHFMYGYSWNLHQKAWKVSILHKVCAL